MKRLASILLILAPALSSSAQFAPPPEWAQSALETWSGVHRVIMPSKKDAQDLMTRGFLEPGRDYAAEVAAMLKRDPSPGDRCAPLLISDAHHVDWPWGTRALALKELEICKAYAPPKERLADLDKWMFPAPLPRRVVIATQSDFTQSNRWYPAYGTYSPPPAEPGEWLERNPQGRDYARDVEAAFNSDPLVAAHVCTSAKTHAPANDPRRQQLHKILLDVCEAFPDAKIEAALDSQRSQAGKTWLNGIMNSLLDENASLSADVRHQQAEALFPRVWAGVPSSERFQNALRLLALVPDDPRAVETVLLVRSNASQGAKRASAADVAAWLRETLESRSGQKSADQLQWKRARRNLLALSGEVMRARDAAREIAKQRDHDTRDTIYEAMLERAAGNRAPYDRLMKDCPAADRYYIQLHGQPERAVRYCEEVVAELAKGARDLGTGSPVPAFAEMARETNRVAPAAPSVESAAQPPRERSREATLDDQFSAAVKTSEERVAKMSEVERERVAAPLINDASQSGLGLEDAVYLAFLQPWHDASAAGLLQAAQRTSYAPRMTSLFARLYEQRAATGPGQQEWKRGQRAFLMFTGDYDRARNLAREIVADKTSPHRQRDLVMHGILEWLNGNRKPFDDVIAACPPDPKDAETTLAREDHCRGTALWQIQRAILTNRKPHAAYAEILRSIARSTAEPEIRDFALNDMTIVAPELAEPEWRDVLRKQDVPIFEQLDAFASLAQIAETRKQWADVIAWEDRWLVTAYPQLPPFVDDSWGFAGDDTSGMAWCATCDDALWRRFRASVESRDFDAARQTVEDSLRMQAGLLAPGWVRIRLIELADAEAKAGQRAEPLRILGYLAQQPLNEDQTRRLYNVRERLAVSATLPELKKEKTPWDSPRQERPRRQAPKPQPETVKT